MSINEIRKNAPEGATHYLLKHETVIYLKHGKKNWVAWSSNMIRWYGVNFNSEPKPL